MHSQAEGSGPQAGVRKIQQHSAARCVRAQSLDVISIRCCELEETQPTQYPLAGRLQQESAADRQETWGALEDLDCVPSGLIRNIIVWRTLIVGGRLEALRADGIGGEVPTTSEPKIQCPMHPRHTGRPGWCNLGAAP